MVSLGIPFLRTRPNSARFGAHHTLLLTTCSLRGSALLVAKLAAPHAPKGISWGLRAAGCGAARPDALMTPDQAALGLIY